MSQTVATYWPPNPRLALDLLKRLIPNVHLWLDIITILPLHIFLNTINVIVQCMMFNYHIYQKRPSQRYNEK